MTTTTVTERLAQEAVEKYSFTDVHFWNRLSNGKVEYDPLHYPRRMLTEWAQGFDEATRQALLEEIDPTGHYAEFVRTNPNARAASVNHMVRHLMLAAAALVKPRY